jgi:hypothetical protein
MFPLSKNKINTNKGKQEVPGWGSTATRSGGKAAPVFSICTNKKTIK